MRFEVPQFIDVEDKIFGPFTFRQFVYLVGGAGLSYLLIKLLPIYIAILLVVPIGAFAGALAFVKVNNKPFLDIVEAGFMYFLRDKLYLWKKDQNKEKKNQSSLEVAKKEPQYIPKMSESKLHDISWGLDVLGSRQKEQ
jgi:hypothetical protein